MNECFFIGKIVSEIKFDFIINGKSIGKKISIVRFCIDVLGEKINVLGYNNIADFCYQKLNIGNNVFIEGILRTDGNIEVRSIKYWKYSEEIKNLQIAMGNIYK